MLHSMEITDESETLFEKPQSFLRRVCKIFCVLVSLVVGLVLLLLLIAIGRTFSMQEIMKLDDLQEIKLSLPQKRLDHFTAVFAESLRFKTVAHGPSDYEREELQAQLEFIMQEFPRIFNSSFITVETVNTLSLLLTIHGTNNSLAPYMLASHFDVVPVQEELWNSTAFLGRIIYESVSNPEVVWGRGAIDDKSGVMGILSAIELLMENNWKPQRSFYVAFGHDEEVSGHDGAGEIAKLLHERNIKIDFLIDEGMPVTKGVVPGVDIPVALVGVTEKGWMNVRLEAEGTGGHSSIPPKDQAVDRLAKAISNLYDYPQPSMYGYGPEKDMLVYLALKANWPYKLFYSNQWLFGPLLSSALSQTRETNSIVRTTTAVTKFGGGVKENVIPATAWALVNHRVHPSQSLSSVLEHDRTVTGDPKVKVTMINGEEAHPVSPYGPDSPAFKLIASAINYVHPEAITVPGIMVANTDSRHYVNLTKQIYRMFPFVLTADEISRIHAENEYLSVPNFEATVKFYQTIMKTVDSTNFVASTDGEETTSPQQMSPEYENESISFKE